MEEKIALLQQQMHNDITSLMDKERETLNLLTQHQKVVADRFTTFERSEIILNKEARVHEKHKHLGRNDEKFEYPKIAKLVQKRESETLKL